MTDTNGPGGPVMTTPLVQGDHLARDRLHGVPVRGSTIGSSPGPGAFMAFTIQWPGEEASWCSCSVLCAIQYPP